METPAVPSLCGYRLLYGRKRGNGNTYVVIVFSDTSTVRFPINGYIWNYYRLVLCHIVHRL